MRWTFNCKCFRCGRKLYRNPIPEDASSILCMDCDSIKRGIHVDLEDRADYDDFFMGDFA